MTTSPFDNVSVAAQEFATKVVSGLNFSLIGKNKNEEEEDNESRHVHWALSDPLSSDDYHKNKNWREAPANCYDFNSDTDSDSSPDHDLNGLKYADEQVTTSDKQPTTKKRSCTKRTVVMYLLQVITLLAIVFLAIYFSWSSDGPNEDKSIATTSQNCTDTNETFLVSTSMKKESCEWLQANPEVVVLLCSENKEARFVCPETCGLCSDACEDTNEEFTEQDEVRNCQWLRESASFFQELCAPDGIATKICPRTCGNCNSHMELPTFIPTPSPSWNPTIKTVTTPGPSVQNTQRTDIPTARQISSPPTTSPPIPSPTATPTSLPTSPPTSTPPETSSPTTPQAIQECLQCSDDPHPYMRDAKEECSVGHEMIRRKCNNNFIWREHRYCQATCYLAGSGYEGDFCCTPSPTSSPSIATPLPLTNPPSSYISIPSAKPSLRTYFPTTLPPSAHPTTLEPTTSTPTTPAPTTLDPTTATPTSYEPTTYNPTSYEPTTYSPTKSPKVTLAPTTSTPTSSEPTTSTPTSPEPTTYSPTKSRTVAPTTSAPTSSAPTTSAPTSSEPTTYSPTKLPTEPPTLPTFSSQATSTPTMATPPPAFAENCQQCSDIPVGIMQSFDALCSDDTWFSTDLINRKCNKNAVWRENKYCQATCYRYGFGYDGDICC